jgi:hypothetical protein
MNENILRRIFIIGIFVYGFTLIAMMGKQTHQTLEILNSAPMADMPPVIELRKENQNFVTYK